MPRTPTVKRGRTVLADSATCPRCPHRIDAHDEDKARQCNLCACVAQDVH